ncbi:glycosyltransferase family 4 protein [candidate division KSB1 bacterium]|nr:glycosyltransferase family 4 protein [candidate division KSB1 bacterium]
MKKSLLYLSVYDPHVPLTGAGVRGAEFVNNLAERFTLDLVYIDGSGHPPNPELSRKFASKVKGVREKIVIPFSQKDYFIFSSGLMQSATELLQKNKYHAILCDYGLSAVYGLKLSKKFRLPFIYCSHNLEYLQYWGKAKADPRRYVFIPYVYWAEKNGVKKSKLLVPISENDAEYYTRWTTREKMVVIPQGFDETIFNPYYDPVENHPKIVLFCGNYNIQTNLDVVRVTVARILEKVIARCPDTKFQFVGSNPPQDIEHPNVEFTGFVEDLPAYLKRADVIISPIQQGWGMPTKIIEALAVGKITIATPIAARSVPREFQLLRVKETDAFPDAICDALNDGKFVSDVDFERLKKHYSWRTNIMRLADRIEAEF